jgi:tetratricopeptide (TPR) repeat protein
VTALLLALVVHSAPVLVAQSDDSKAKALFKEGETAYNLGQFDVALGKYTEAYKLKPLPGFLFNIAQCHRQLGQYERAAFFFGRFIDTSAPKAPNVDVAKGLLDEMKQKQAEQKTADESKAAEEARKAEAAKKAQDELKEVQIAPPEPPPTLAPLAPVEPLPPPVVESAPVYTRGWFWGVIVGVVVVGAAVGVTVGVATAPKPPTPTLMDINGRM